MLAFSLTGCEDENTPEPVNEEELITTVILTWTDGSGGVATMTYEDLDGTGPDVPVVSADPLTANTTYTVAASFLNNAEDPAEDITIEIKDEDDEHQVFFLIDQGLNLSFTYSDMDDNQNPIGLLNDFTTGDASQGNLNVVLRHEPNKSAAGVSDGDITNAGGETDISIDFDVVIQ